jgi:SEC-C motif-containing protein
MKLCPCGSKKRYMDCCGIYIQKKVSAETPEALMRSRYSAFVEGNILYIRKTMRGPALLGFDKKNFKADTTWLGLEVIATAIDPQNPNLGTVEFKAKYKSKQNKPTIAKDNVFDTNAHINIDITNGIANGIMSDVQTLHEKSQFEKISGKWYYISGDLL